MIKKSIQTVILVVITSILYNCSKDNAIFTGAEMNKFVWGGLNAFYRWQATTPDLSDSKFANEIELNNYLSSVGNSEDFFKTLLNPDDSISKMVENYNELHDAFNGKIKSNGLKISIARYGDNSDKVYGFVRYVVKNSGVDSRIVRGTVFNQVNGTQLTEGNYKELITTDEYKITVANFNNGNPTATSNVFSLTKSILQEDPILASNIIEQNGKKIGYIALSKFTPNYDNDINTIFGSFKGVNDVIVDLRNCESGSIESTGYLASMVTGQFENELFTTQDWNEKVTENINIKRRNIYFSSEINNGFTNKETINSLNLTKVYVLTSKLTASTAEVFINSLKTYIDVKVIGQQTMGQFLCSSILYDSKDYSRNGENFNQTHTAVLYPIVSEAKNNENQNNENGIFPDNNTNTIDTPNTMGTLGETSDNTIKTAIDYIVSGTKPTSSNSSVNVIWNSEEENIDYKTMHANYSK